MNLTALETLLQERIGLDVKSLGSVTLPRVVAARMASFACSTSEQYTSLVQDNAAEWDALLGELLVPETWFFRGGSEFFEYLARCIRTRLTESVNGRNLRVLCIPCSTGEEPYSLAIALDRAGIPATRCVIDGVDISRDRLLRSVTARYTAFSFREVNADPRKEYFDEVEPGLWELRAEVRGRVHFRSGNLVDPGSFQTDQPYDLILCRNLFIYLTANGAARAMANLERLLAADGLLCLTAAEADRIPAARFTSDGPTSLAIFKRIAGDAPPAPRSNVVRFHENKPASAVKPKPAPSSVIPTSPVPPPVATRVDPLIEGRRFADAGNLVAARLACEAAPESAARFSLFGVIQLAEGRTEEAADAFRKALYLNPNETEALMHMVLLCEQRGDPGQAAGLRRRLDRLAKGAAT